MTGWIEVLAIAFFFLSACSTIIPSKLVADAACLAIIIHSLLSSEETQDAGHIHTQTAQAGPQLEGGQCHRPWLCHNVEQEGGPRASCWAGLAVLEAGVTDIAAWFMTGGDPLHPCSQPRRSITQTGNAQACCHKRQMDTARMRHTDLSHRQTQAYRPTDTDLNHKARTPIHRRRTMTIDPDIPLF